MSRRQITERQTVQALNGRPTLLGTITSSGSSTTNASTAVPFSLDAAAPVIVVQPTADCYLVVGTSSSVSASSSTGLKILQDEKFLVVLKNDDTHLAFIPSSGSADLLVFKLE